MFKLHRKLTVLINQGNRRPHNCSILLDSAIKTERHFIWFDYENIVVKKSVDNLHTKLQNSIFAFRLNLNIFY